LITLLVTSSTWKESALAADDRSAGVQHGEHEGSRFDLLDPDNVLLHKWTVRRLEGEAIRDTTLAVSGRLDLVPPQDSVATHLTSFMTGRGRPGQSGPLDGDGKRSIYLEVRRNFMSPMMLAFDTPQAAQTFGRRARSNVPAQALILMNDPFVQQQAKLMAERMESALPDQPPEVRIGWLYAQALQREPSADERAAALEFLGVRVSNPQAGARKSIPQLADSAVTVNVGLDIRSPEGGMNSRAPSAEAWADLSHVLFNTKEFVFVN
jgi:hypothetical protein